MTGSALRWGLLSTASIGETVVHANRGSEVAEFVAVASRDAEKARRFADRLDLPVSFASYEELLTSDSVDAVYVALPVSMHTEWTVKALQAGKHVLCEKPFATSAADARRCVDAAEKAGVVCVEGLMYRHHPRTELARKLVAEGAIGEVTLVRGALSVAVPPDDIRRNRALGGGALGDLGAYCSSAFRLFAGEPRRVHAERVLDKGEDPVDLRVAATLRSRSGVLGTFDVGLDLPRRDELEIIGTEGRVVVDDPWLCRDTTVQVWRDGSCVRHEAEHTSVSGDDEGGVYRLEFETVSSAIKDAAALPFGADDLMAQASVHEALTRSADSGQPVELSAQLRR